MAGDVMDRSTVEAAARIGGEWRTAARLSEVRDPYRNVVVGTAPVSTAQDCTDAIKAASSARAAMAAMPGYERAGLLRRIADNLSDRADAIGKVMSRETGKALRDCCMEPLRSAETLRLCAEEAVRIEGEHVPMDASAIGAGKLAIVTRFPVGVVAAITPFNGPVHLAAHKLGPALAAGNPIIIKPSPKAPLSLHMFIEAAIAAGAPDGAINTLFGDDIGPQFISDPAVDFISFTGSIPVGKIIRANAGMKRVALELGGVGPTFVHHDADICAAAIACARNAMMLAGQSCVSVQNVYVHHSVYEEFLSRLVEEAAAIRFGDPLHPDTEVGTLIDEGAARRVESMIQRATARGAKVATGGERNGALLGATILTNVSGEMDVVRDEIFGPVATVQPYTDIQPIFDEISTSAYGLQCGIFTNSLDLAMKAYRGIRTGGVIVNATSRWRSDQMPYGGVKDSGMGREGPKYAIRDMTDERLLVLN